MLVGKWACLGLGRMGRLLLDVYIPIVRGDARLENGNGATMLRRSSNSLPKKGGGEGWRAAKSHK